MFVKSLAIVLIFAAAGCSSVVPSTLMRLNALDPFTADPNDMAVALDLPAGLAMEPHSTVMTFIAVHSPSGETHERNYVLEEQRLGDGQVIYALSAADVADLEAMKAALLPWKETSDGNSTLSMGVSSDACRLKGVDLALDPRVSVALRLEADGPLRPFLRNAPVLEYFDVEDLAQMPQCSTPF